MKHRITWTDENGKTYVGREQRKLPRKTIVGLVALALVAVAGVAFALYVLTASVTGNTSTKSLSYMWDNLSTPTKTGTASTCSATAPAGATPGNSLDINVSSYPGDTCTITAKLKTSGSESAKVTGTAFTGLPTGWKAEVDPATCGVTVGSTLTSVTFTITVGPSGSGTLGGGLTLSPVSQVSGTPTCTAQVAP